MSGISFKNGVCLAASAAMMTTAAQADVLFNVDLSVPNEVTITATSGLSAVTTSGNNIIGVYFENFYNSSTTTLVESLVSGNLTNAENPADNSPNLFRGVGGTDPGLNIFSWSTTGTVTFTAGSLAFTGAGTWSLDPDEYADMVAGNASGNLYFPADTADDIGGADILGTYRVIPTPGALSLIGLGGIAAVRRRR